MNPPKLYLEEVGESAGAEAGTPFFRDHILFYEYFHGDNGAGLGASHRTGWTGVVAKLIQLFGFLDSQKALAVGKTAAFIRGKSEGEVKK